jgi:hypothetical protein
MPDLSGTPPTVQLRAESDPPGAEARASTGQVCNTPCALAVPASGDLSVTFSANGYVPQTVPVHVRAPGDPRADPNAGYGTQIEPNPVSAALDPAPPPKPVRHRRAPRHRTPHAAHTAPHAAAPARRAAPPAPPPTAPGARAPLPSGGFAPPPAAPPSDSAYPPLPSAPAPAAPAPAR